jgi:hypothetical protein
VHEATSLTNALYQYHDVGIGKTGLFASVKDYSGPIEYGVIINEDLSGDANCHMKFENSSRRFVQKCTPP